MAVSEKTETGKDFATGRWAASHILQYHIDFSGFEKAQDAE